MTQSLTDNQLKALSLTDSQAKFVSDQLATNIVKPEPLTNDELIDLAKRQQRVDAGLGVMVSVTTALAALYVVLTDDKFYPLLKKLPDAVKAAIGKAMTRAKPLFDGVLSFQDDDLRKKFNTLLDSGVGLAYSIEELPGSSDTKTADSIALYSGVVKEGLPFVLLCVEIIQCCLNLLAAKDATVPQSGDARLSAKSETICRDLIAKLETEKDARDKTYKANLEKGRQLLLEAEKKAVPLLTN